MFTAVIPPVAASGGPGCPNRCSVGGPGCPNRCSVGGPGCPNRCSVGGPGCPNRCSGVYNTYLFLHQEDLGVQTGAQWEDLGVQTGAQWEDLGVQTGAQECTTLTYFCIRRTWVSRQVLGRGLRSRYNGATISGKTRQFCKNKKYICVLGICRWSTGLFNITPSR